MSIPQPAPLQLAVFASGTGSNAAKLADYFGTAAQPVYQQGIIVSLIVTNKKDAGVLQVAADRKLPTLVLEKERFFRGDAYVPVLKEAGIDFIVLAGFLWKVPSALIQAYPHHIVNIHPALLPAYGGKGMYGHFVHEAVLANKDLQSGITIHYVDEQYDHGAVIFQVTCPVLPGDTPDTLAQRVHQLEHTYYPKVVAETVLKAGEGNFHPTTPSSP